MADIRQQVRDGAIHISFGDPDFFNGPTHAMRLARALNEAFPNVTFDATIKSQHLIDHAELLPKLRRCGCLFITSAVEAVDDAFSPKTIRVGTLTARCRSPVKQALRLLRLS